MSDQIGRISVPTPPVATIPVSSLTGAQFPLISEFGYGQVRNYRTIPHRFGELATLAEQQFLVGVGPRIFPFRRTNLSYTERTALWNFWEAVQGPYQSFSYAAPQPDKSFVNYQTIFEAAPLSVEELVNSCRAGFNLVECPDPSQAPNYPVSSTCLRFPSSTLQTALQQDVQQIIPLLHIRVRESAVPDIWLSDRRLTLTDASGGTVQAAMGWAGSSQVYLPRVTGLGEPGSDVILTQSIDGKADNVRFAFGNADRVMTQLVNDTDLQYASIDWCFYHVQTGILLQLWKGSIIHWSTDGSAQFPITASDGLYQANLLYPNRIASRQCWKAFKDGKWCPYATAGSGGDPLSCSYYFTSTYDPTAGTNPDGSLVLPGGCTEHNMTPYFGGQPADPQGVNVKDNSTGVWGIGRNTVTATSIISDTWWGQALPENWCNAGSLGALGAMWVNAIVVDVRDEGDYEDMLGVIGSGPIAQYAGMSVVTNADGYKFIVAPLGDGFPPQGFKVNSQLGITSNTNLGLREISGTDPATGGGDDQGSFSLGQGTPQAWGPERAAGVAFVELRYAKPSGITPTTADQHSMQVPLLQGLYGRIWNASDVASYIPGLTNPFWIAINSWLRAQGLTPRATDSSGDIATQLATFVRSSLFVGDGSGCAEIADLAVAPLLGGSIAPTVYVVSALAQSTLFNLNFDPNAGILSYSTDPDGNLVGALSVAAAVAAGYLTAISTSGLETQFMFQGTVAQQKPFRDWLTEILSCALGYFTFEFGRLKLGIRSNASAVAAFTLGNMLYQSLTLEPLLPAFEHLIVNFADVAYQFQANTVEYSDKDHAAYYGRPGAPLTANQHVVGCSTLSQGARIAAIRTREEIGGVDAAEWKAARLATWRTTILALDTAVGQVVSVTHPDVPGGTGNFRVQRMQFHRDWSITLQAKTVTSSMYDLEVGPKPTDVKPAPLPVLFYPQPLGQWAPYQIQADPADALFPSEWTFGLTQSYAPLDAAGNPIAQAILATKQGVNQFIPNCGAPDVKSGSVAQSATGGNLPGGTTYYVQVCGVDAAGRYTPPSDVLLLQIPSGTNTNQFTLQGIVWPALTGLVGYVVFASDAADRICGQQTGALSGGPVYSPTTIAVPGPFARFTYAVPNAALGLVRVRARRLIHGGVIGAGVTSVSSTEIVSSDCIDAALTDNWTGRALAVIGRATGAAPFAALRCSAFDPSTGAFTLDRNPVTAGVQADDAFVVCFLGYDNSVDPYTITDAGLANATNAHAGEATNDPNRIGNYIFVISGTSRGQSAKIISNTSTSYGLDSPLVLDATSVYIVVTASWEASVDAPVTNADPSKATQISLPVSNYDSLPVVIEMVAVDNTGVEVDDGDAPLRMLFVFGEAGSGGAAPPSGLSYTPAQFEYGQVSANDVAVSSLTPVTGIDWALAVVDEMNADPATGCWVTSPAVNGTSDPVAITVTPNAAQTSTLHFAQGDYVVFSDPGAYEICQITALSGANWTLARAQLGSTKAAHLAGVKIYKLQIRKFPWTSPIGTGATPGVPTRFDFDAPNCLVAAIIGNPYTSGGYGGQVITYTATATLPGLRTLMGNNYTFQESGTLAANPGVNAGPYNKLVQYPSTLRVAFASVGTEPTGADLHLNIRRSVDGGATWTVLFSLVIAAGNLTSYAGITPTPGNANLPYGASWPVVTLNPGDLLNYSVEQVGSSIAGANLNLEIYV